jgi:hypothetical protein
MDAPLGAIALSALAIEPIALSASLHPGMPDRFALQRTRLVLVREN